MGEQFYHRKRKDVMTRYPIYNPETNVLEYLGTNLPYRNFAVLETSFPVKITKWWNINTQITGYYNDEFRPYLNEIFALKIYSYEARLNQVFSLPKGFAINLLLPTNLKMGIVYIFINLDIQLIFLYRNLGLIIN